MFPSLTGAERQKAVDCLRAIPVAEVRSALRETQLTGRGGRKSVEWIVAETEGTGRRLSSRIGDDRLHEFLVDLNGVDLLGDRELRLRLARHADPDRLSQLHEYPSSTRGRGGAESQAKAVADRNWHPGKGWARHFARVLGFPLVFAGLPGNKSEPHIEQVEPFRPLKDLEDFQLELKEKVLSVISGAPEANRGILTLPTGAGKTRTAVEALVESLVQSDGRLTILWIAQSEELCEQAVVAFREVWVDLGHRKAEVRSPLTIQRLWGGRSFDEFETGVIVASIQKLERMSSNDEGAGLLNLLGEALSVIVVDEAHRMFAKSYGQVLRALGVDPSHSGGTPVLGLTATPYRSQDDETRRLAARFGNRLLEAECLGADPEGALLERGVLAKAVYEVIEHNGPVVRVSDDPLYKQYGEISPRALQGIGQDRERNKLILGRLLELPREWPVLFFGCSVEHAAAISVLLRRNGRTSATVIGETPPATRRFLIEQFRAKNISVLSNYGVLTTGFDAPSVRALVVARPTASMVLYQQMIGRGLRGPRFGGTAECLIVDVADNLDIADKLAFRNFRGYWSRAATGTGE
jgi:superfamily II DNA or RNA helicase